MLLGLIMFFSVGSPFVRSVPVVKAVEGQTIYIECPASGYPINKLTWQKGWMIFFKSYIVSNICSRGVLHST
jgi:hypothetical protein